MEAILVPAATGDFQEFNRFLDVTKRDDDDDFTKHPRGFGAKEFGMCQYTEKHFWSFREAMN